MVCYCELRRSPDIFSQAEILSSIFKSVFRFTTKRQKKTSGIIYIALETGFNPLVYRLRLLSAHVKDLERIGSIINNVSITALDINTERIRFGRY